jgi:hypothetical protein
MTNPDSPSWQVLRHKAAQPRSQPSTFAPPRLLYRLTTFTSGSTRLHLHLTDLVTLYAAELSRADVIAESSRNSSPIDPTEQFDVFLNYLAQGLQGKDNVLAHGVRSKDGSDTATGSGQLSLTTSTSLPGPLSDLRFTFSLEPQLPSTFSHTILGEAIRYAQSLQTQRDSLLEIVRDKDHVIARLLERVGTQAGGDMSLVFPTLTGRKSRRGAADGGVGIKDAEKWVPGLKSFDALEWQRGIGEGGEAGLIGVASCDWLDDSRKQDDDWLTGLPSADEISRPGMLARGSTYASQARGGDGDVDMDTQSEEDFERQATPPSLRKRGYSSETSDQGNHSDSEDAQSPPMKKQRMPTASSSEPAKKLGAIGRRKKPEPTRPLDEVDMSTTSHTIRQRAASTAKPSSPPPAPSAEDTPAEPESDATETASEDSDLDAVVKPRAAPPPAPTARKTLSPHASSPPGRARSSPPATPPPPQTQTPKRRLGRLTKRRERTPSVSPPLREGDGAGGDSSAHSTPHKLGKLGLRRKAAAVGTTTTTTTTTNHGRGRGSSPRPADAKADLTSKPAISSETPSNDDDTDEDLDVTHPKTTTGSAQFSVPAADEIPAELPLAMRKAIPPREGRDLAADDEGDGDLGGKSGSAREAELLKQNQKQKQFAATTTTTEEEKEKDEKDEKEAKEEETAEQAAARRRAELKKTVAAPVAKRKRRF